ncbi:heat shock protein HspQ [Xanthobacter agilis]|uniref:Heat shock protein HspQ n=2 Tax=Xanthobacter agilis TaxID=47492 RepID=A0ABU0LBA1_XANAG|nr:heat shock protein HspQ [Xanthobacter agilis]
MGTPEKTSSPSAVGTVEMAGALPPPVEVPAHVEAQQMRMAKFRIGEVVRHKHFPFRGVVFDVDPVFDNTEEWWLSIPEDIRPDKEQPFYHLFAENADNEYVAYVSEQNLELDPSDEPVRHPRVNEMLREDGDGGWRVLPNLLN